MDRSKLDIIVRDTLKHYGKKGMKWGVTNASDHTSGSNPRSDDFDRVAKSAETVKKHGTKSLSNNELKELVNRMQMDTQYRDLKSREPSKIKNGIKFAKNAMAVARFASDAARLVKTANDLRQ